MRILIVEDERKIADSLKTGLLQESFAVDVAYDGKDGYDLAETTAYDVILLDIMLPGMDGIEVTKRLRSKNIHTPILMLTAKSQTEDKVQGLNVGADDYLSKPFSFDELLARIRALTRRPIQSTGTSLKVANLTLNPNTFEVSRDNKLLRLSRKEFSLLEYLMRNKNKTLTKDQIIENVWNFDADVLPNTVEVYIGYLRTKIDKDYEEKLIKTVRGFGYRIEG